MLLTVSSLNKQNLRSEYSWLKDHNLEVKWEKGEVEMTYYPPIVNIKNSGLVFFQF